MRQRPRSRAVELAAVIGALLICVGEAGGNHPAPLPLRSFSEEAAASSGSISIGGYPIDIAYDPVNNFLYVTLQESSSFHYNMTVINATNSRVVAELPMPYGVSTLAVDTRYGYVYVGNCCNTVYAIDPLSEHVAWNVSVGCPDGCSPEAQTYDSANGQIFLTDLGNNNVSVVEGRNFVTTFRVGSGPNGATYDPANGKVFVADEGAYALTVINGSTDAVVGRIAPVDPGPGVTYDSSNGDVYVCENNASGPNASNFVTAVNGSSDTIIAAIPIASSCGAAVYDPVNDYVYITDQMSPSGKYLSNVTVVDPRTNRIVLTQPVQLGPDGVAFDSANHNIYVADTYGENISVLPQLFRVTFRETGLPEGTNWSVIMGGRDFSSSTSTISFPEMNGSCNFTIARTGSYTAIPASGEAMVVGKNQVLSVAFSNSTGPKGSAGFLGLPLWTGYSVLGGLAVLILIASVVVIRRRREHIGVSPPSRLERTL